MFLQRGLETGALTYVALWQSVEHGQRHYVLDKQRNSIELLTVKSFFSLIERESKKRSELVNGRNEIE